YWAISLWHRRADVQPLRLRPQRLDRRLDRILLGLVDFMVPVRGGIHCPYFAWPHDTAVRRRRTARTYGVHIHVDDGVWRYGHLHDHGRGHATYCGHGQ